MMSRTLAIIPARAGSKRLRGKNVRRLAGQPLISWTIAAAQRAKHLDRIVVSSDDEEALRIASCAGVTSLRRPAHLATDDASSLSVVQHVLNEIDPMNCAFDVVVLLQPTSPLRNSADIESALSIFQDQSINSIASVVALDNLTRCSARIDDDMSLDSYLKNLGPTLKIAETDRPSYKLNGAIYAVRISALLQEKSFYCYPSRAYVMPRIRSFDIDDEVDFLICEVIASQQIDFTG